MAENEKLNLHTDPSGLMASLNASNEGGIYLGDIQAVERMLRDFAGEVFTRYDEVGHGVLTPEDAANADRADCERLARVFCGQEDGYAVERNWTGKPLADHLRQRMARDIQPSDDDANIVAQALAVMVHRLYDVLRAVGSGAGFSAMAQQTEEAVKSMSKALVGVVGND